VARIIVNAEVEQWLNQAVFRIFEERGITVTTAAKNIIGYTVQAQREEAVPRHLKEALDAIDSQIQARESAEGTYFDNAIDVFLELYPPTAILNLNRAVRLMAEMYFRRFGGFPCGPTGGSETGSDSGEGGRGSHKSTKTKQKEPATAGA
jgi:hypothetical protein